MTASRYEKFYCKYLNGKDFKALAEKSPQTGVICVSQNLPNAHIDTKLTALYGRFTTITGET